MTKIRTKLLLAFLASIFLLSLSSFYAVFFINRLSQAIYDATILKDASDDIISHSDSINNILNFYSVADNEKLPALKSEYDFSMNHFHHAIETLEVRKDFSKYTVVIRKMHEENMAVAAKLMDIRGVQAAEKSELESIIGNLKKFRHEAENELTKGSEKLKLDIIEIGYKEKEYNFQYKDKKHAEEWLAAIKKVKNELAGEKINAIAPLVDAYYDLALEAIGKNSDISDLELRRQYYLVQVDNIILENKVASGHINRIINGELNKISSEGTGQKQISFVFILLSLAIGSFSVLFISGNISRSMEKLVSVARKVSEGDLDQKADVRMGDEIGYLAKVFNEMIDSINKSQVEMTEETNRIKAVISSMGEGLLVLDRDLNIVLVNRTAENALKVSLSKVFGRNIREVLTLMKGSELLPIEEWPARRMFRTGKPVRITMKDNYYYKTATGRLFPVEITTAPYIREGIVGAIVIFRDMSDVKTLEEEREFARVNLENVLKSVYIERDAVREQKNRLEAILNSIGDAVFVVDKQRKLVVFNPVAEKVTGFKSADIKGRTYSSHLKFIDEVTKKEKSQFIDSALKGERTMLTNHTVLMTKDKNLISIDQTTAPIRDSKNKVMGCVVVFRDVTAKREVERMRSDFISIISHQLRTPLSGIKWFMEILLSGDVGRLNQKQSEMIREIHINNQNMIELVDKMLNISRIENNRLVINLESMNLDGMVKNIIGEIKPIIDKKKQVLRFTGIKDKKLVFNVDKILLKTIINNLVMNASRYAPTGGKISLSVALKNKDYLQFTIKDNGIGIPEKEQYKVFKRFFRASNAIKYEANGTGLGLYIVKSILDMIGGEIWFDSEEDKGTSFHFTLPLDISSCKIR